MRDQATWSLGLGRWAGILVRVHIFYVLFAIFTLYLGWKSSQDHIHSDGVWIAAVFLLIHFASVVFHGFSHCHMVLKSGDRIDYLVLGPLGEMNAIHNVVDPRQEFAIVLAGPMANLFICLIGLLLLVMTGQAGDLFGLLHPLQPSNVIEGGTLEQFLKISFWMNWILFLVNILPIFPQDGGRVLRSIFLILWSDMGQKKATLYVARAAQVIAISLFVVAVLLRDVDPAGLVPIWFALVLLGMFLIFAAQHEIDRSEEQMIDDDCFGYDFSQGFTSFNQNVESPSEFNDGRIARWLQRRREVKQRRLRAQEMDEERRMDEILSRLHEGGINYLSAEDRRLLDRVSARYRSRKD